MADTLITFFNSFTPFQERVLLAFIGGLIPALIWLFFWLREDDCKNQDSVAYMCEPEPKPMLFLTFVTGMLMVPVALFAERGVYPYVAGLGLIIAWSSIEELLKLLAYWFVNAKSKFMNEATDPAIYMLTAALGFAAAENAFFLYQSLSMGTPLSNAFGGQYLRFIGASLLHVGASGILGIFIGLTFFRSAPIRFLGLLVGIILAITLHVVFNHLIIFTDQTEILRVFSFVWVLGLGVIILFERLKELAPYTRT
ncbi:MAG: PrsW family glutamic-type intramembrane protease [Minisyncoccia bacterium]